MPLLSAQVVDSEPKSVLMDTYQGVIIRGNAGGRSVMRLIRWGYSKASVLAMWDCGSCVHIPMDSLAQSIQCLRYLHSLIFGFPRAIFL